MSRILYYLDTTARVLLDYYDDPADLLTGYYDVLVPALAASLALAYYRLYSDLCLLLTQQ